MDAVLPLTAADLPRAEQILLPSLLRHYRDLGRLLVVCPSGDLVAMSARLHHHRVQVIDEATLVPEFAVCDRLGLPKVGGWFRQQLVKLAIAPRIQSDFVLTLDADVIALSDFGDADCIRHGRAIRHRHSKDSNPQWLDWAARVLDLPALDYQPGVTPAFLSRSVLIELADYIAKNVRPVSARFRAGTWLGRLSPRWRVDTWRGRLITSLPWTEYSLYDTFLAGTGRFSSVHTEPTDTLLLANSVWEPPHFVDWRPLTRDQEDRKILFSVVQSRVVADVAAVLARLSSSRPADRLSG